MYSIYNQAIRKTSVESGISSAKCGIVGRGGQASAKGEYSFPLPCFGLRKSWWVFSFKITFKNILLSKLHFNDVIFTCLFRIMLLDIVKLCRIYAHFIVPGSVYTLPFHLLIKLVNSRPQRHKTFEYFQENSKLKYPCLRMWELKIF
jgi:hypothetical protein